MVEISADFGKVSVPAWSQMEIDEQMTATVDYRVVGSGVTNCSSEVTLDDGRVAVVQGKAVLVQMVPVNCDDNSSIKLMIEGDLSAAQATFSVDSIITATFVRKG